MRIGIDGRFWNESGVGRYIRNLVRELATLDKENEYILFVTNESRNKNSSNSVDKQGLEKINNLKNWKIVPTDIRWHTVGEQLRFPSLLNSYNLDLIHFPYFSVPIFYNRPFVVTIHDLILHHFATGKATTLPKPVYWAKLKGYKFVLDQAAKRSQKIITVSEATKKEIVDHLEVLRDKVVVTYEGVDTTLVPQKKSGRNDEYFLYVGNMYPHKNVEVLIRAFSELSDTKVTLKIVGREDFFQQQMLDLSNNSYRNPNIEFLTHVDDKELSVLYQNALALVSPSLMEGFGLPLIEAMSLGCLVVASDIPSSREICKEAALYFDPRNRESLRVVLEKVMRAKIERKKFIDYGLKRARIFSWEKMARETREVYLSAL